MARLMKPEGTNFRLTEFVPATLLSASLCTVAAFLQELDPDDTLQRYDDWWQHDGLEFERDRIDLHGLLELVKSPQAICESMPADDYVRVGIASPKVGWYLRFYLTWNAAGDVLEGDFDITLPGEHVERFKQVVMRDLAVRLEVEDACAYYARILR